MFFPKSHKEKSADRSAGKSAGQENQLQKRKSFPGRDREMVCTVSGTREVCVENYGSLGDFSEEKIILNGYKSRMVVEGERLGIEYFTDVDMKITGRLRAIRFL